jgi:hypothetical protein
MRLEAGDGVLRIGRVPGVGTSTVQRVRREPQAVQHPLQIARALSRWRPDYLAPVGQNRGALRRWRPAVVPSLVPREDSLRQGFQACCPTACPSPVPLPVCSEHGLSRCPTARGWDSGTSRHRDDFTHVPRDRVVLCRGPSSGAD